MAGLRETLEREVKLSPGKRFAMPELGGEALVSRVFVSTFSLSATGGASSDANR